LATREARHVRADAERNRQRLLAAACDLFIELGAEAPLETIARRADVGIATLYRHFPDRAALVRAVAGHVLGRAAAEARAALEEEPSGFDALRRYMHRALDARVAVMNRILGAVGSDADLQTRWQESGSAVRGIIDRAKGEGSLRADAEFVDIAIALVRFSRPIGGGFPPGLEEMVAHRHLEIYVDGLRAEGATPFPAESARSLAGFRPVGGRPASPEP
jgi:AcrR family transcriptional regulator